MSDTEFLSQPTRRSLLGAAAASPLALLAGVNPGLAQAWPSRPVRITVPFAPGGIADITVRIVADRLGAKLGQNFVVENQPGPGGIAAARAALAGGTDGHTLALFSNGTAISVGLFNSLRYDPVKDFAPVSALGFFDFVFAVAGDGRFHTMAEFLAEARQKPGSLNVGTIAIGSTQNLSAELLKTAAGIDFRIVPFRSTPEALLATLRGDMHLVIDSYATMKGDVQAGKIRLLATSGAVRSLVLPDLPTAIEAGVPGYDVTSWNAIFAPAGAPAPVIATLNKAIAELLAEPEIKKKLLDLGIEARATTPDELAVKLKSDIAKWSAIIEKAGVQKQ